MKKIVIISIIVAAILAAAVYALSVHKDDKKLPGDSMTEKAIENVESGNPAMDGENLPANNKPKSNDLQGSGAAAGELKGGVIIEGTTPLK
ncbi:MAG TPA: hypothetical protein VHQ41_02470 [Patescibacteria group bacterium]|jgi:hypothetical protein|nr:hypothetical protein [Patescibacteria group bacterium]